MRFSGPIKLDICNRLDNDWRKVADYFEIPISDRRRFDRGEEPSGVWEWLEQRDRFKELPKALRYIQRPELAAILEENVAPKEERPPRNREVESAPLLPQGMGVSSQRVVVDDDRLIRFLEGLVPGDLDRVILRLHGADSHIPPGAPHLQRVADLIRYVRSTTGPGLQGLVEVVDRLFPGRVPLRPVTDEEEHAKDSSAGHTSAPPHLPRITEHLGAETATDNNVSSSSHKEGTEQEKTTSATATLEHKVAMENALVLKGGGVKGLALVGALKEIERFYQFDTFVGTSAGSIVAVLLAAGYTAIGLEEELKIKILSSS